MRHAMLTSPCKIDDNLDVVRPVLERLAPARERNAARDQGPEPRLVGLCQRLCRHLVVAAVGVDSAERLVAEDAAVMAGRRLAVVAGEDLAVGAADDKRQRAHEDRPVRRRGLRHVLEPGGPLHPRCQRDGAHGYPESTALMAITFRGDTPGATKCSPMSIM